MGSELETLLPGSRLYDVPGSLVAFLSVAYGAVSLAAVIGNCAVLWFVVRSHRLRTVTNIFIANLAVADILIGALAIPFQFVAALLQRWILPHFMCPFCAFVQIVSVNVSIFTLTAIAADRYLIVGHLLHFRINKQRAKSILIQIWVIAVLVASPAAVALQVALVPDVDERALDLLFLQTSGASQHLRPDVPLNLSLNLPYKYMCDNRGLDSLLWRWYNRSLVFIQYILPVCVLTFAYGKMALRLRGSSGEGTVAADKLSQHVPSNEGSRDRRSPSEIELSTHSATAGGKSQPRVPTTTTSASSNKTLVTMGEGSGQETRALSLATNAEYIAANKRRVSP